MEDRYYSHNRRKYKLNVHLVFATKYRRKILQNRLETTLKNCCQKTAARNRWKIIAMETDIDHIHILLEYDTTECVASIAGALKQNTTYTMWKFYPQILKQYYWKGRKLWSDGYFACSVGEASASAIQKYINSQG